MIKAYAVHEPKGSLIPFEYDPGPLGRMEVELDVISCGICHSDLSVIDSEWGESQYPLVAGHEVIGSVSSLGDSVRYLDVGDNVGLGWHAGYCMNCHSCRSGDHNLCPSAQPTIIGRHGGFSDKVRAGAESLLKLPQAIDLESAGPLLCGGITVFNPLFQFDVKPTDKVAVIGVGGLGHLALQFYNAWGCEVTAFTSSRSKKEEIIELGAHHILDSRDLTDIEAAQGQFDFIISTVNAKLDWNAYIKALRPRGRLHFVGATMQPLDVGAIALITGQRSLSGSPVGSPATIDTMLEFAVRNNIRPVVEKYSFKNINEALERLRSGQARYRVVLCR